MHTMTLWHLCTLSPLAWVSLGWMDGLLALGAGVCVTMATSLETTDSGQCSSHGAVFLEGNNAQKQ